MIDISIVTIGDELLIGQVIDTNSAWMAQALNKAGFAVKRRVAVGDSWDDIWKVLDEERACSSVILITGGLGPTADDITKPLLCEYFGGKLVQDIAALKNVEYLFAQIFNRPVTERNVRQADVPDVCTVLQNKGGTAPGMQFEKDGKIFISLPGVPHEMQGLMQDEVIPLLQKRFSPGIIAHRTLLTFGIGESMLADLIEDFENALPKDIKLAYLPNHGMVRLRLTARGTDEAYIQQSLDENFTQLKTAVEAFLVTDKDEPMEAAVRSLLIAQQKTLSTAESCTGGYIAHLLTAMPGASAIFEGSIVSYSNQMKQNLLGVKAETLEKQGAVSEASVNEMLQGLLRATNTNYGIAVSGIMGPDGGNAEKPVGTVWIAVGDKTNQVRKRFHFRFNRQRNIELTAVNALNMLRQFALDAGKKN